LLEVADIFRRHGAAYRQKFAKRLLPRHLRTMAAIESCRTAALGGQVFVCDHCDQKLYAYHSCKNRHCPKCHGEQTRRWLDTQRGRLLLDCPFYHLTFTLPEEIRPLARAHSKVVYRLLMQAAAAAILKLARDPRYLGAATPGLLAVLHTWTRAMLYHPHVHLLVTAGGLSDDGTAWVQPKYRHFFLPERPLSAIFRRKFRHRLKKAGLFALVPKSAWSKPWVVDCKHAGRGEKLLDYLGRYLFRIAIANSRLDQLSDDGTVRFHYRDNRSGDLKTATLSAEQFISRFLAHVLPERFTKVRYSGLFSSRNRHRLELARRLTSAEALSSKTPQPVSSDATALQSRPGAVLRDTAADRARCPRCKVGRLILIEVIAPPRRIRGKPP
jgi:putative transposase/transposase-like zinc-binding protein